MANTINADNGVSSGSAGLKSSSDGTGILALQTNGTTAVTVDASQNVGIGTSSPSHKLQVFGASNPEMRLGDATVTYQLYTEGATAAVMGTVGSHALVYRTNATERMRIDSSGNVGIGTSSPNFVLDVIGTVTGNAGGVVSVGDSTSFATGVGGRLLFKGKYNTAGNYAEFASIQGIKENATDGNFAGSMLFNTRQNGAGNWTERMRIDSGGNLLLNTTTVRNTAKFTIDYNGASAQGLVLNNTDTGSASQLAMQFYRGATPSVVGQITTTNAATAYVTSSDYRLKENITPMTGALAKVSALKPITYKWKIDGSDSDGFIAHELAEVCPQAVYGEKDAVNVDGDIVPQGIDTSFLVATLTAAIQEQQALITALTARIEALEAK